MYKKLLISGLAMWVAIGSFAQETATTPTSYQPSKTQFMIRGYAHAGLEYKEVDGEKQSTFVGSSFSPLFIFRHSDRLLFEAELEFAHLQDNSFEVGFEYANLSYVLNDYMTIRMGKFLLPFGTFVERLHPAWINRFSNMPLGFGHDGIAPISGIGVELRGAIPMGSAKLLYSLYSTNGPRLNTGDDEPEEAGLLHFDNFNDNNNNKAIGGRLALLPFANSSLELGASLYSGTVGDQDDPEYGDVGATMLAYDLSFVRQISALRGVLDVKAQYMNSNVDEATYFKLDPGDTIPTPYTFDNSSTAYFGQISYRPSMASSALRNFELATRYSVIKTPEGAEWEQHATQWSLGLNYWLNWRTVFKLSYQQTVSEGGHEAAPGQEITTNAIFLHWGIGF